MKISCNSDIYSPEYEIHCKIEIMSYGITIMRKKAAIVSCEVRIRRTKITIVSFEVTILRYKVNYEISCSNYEHDNSEI